MRETLNKIDKNELVEIASQLEEKSRVFQKHLNIQAISSLNEDSLNEIFRYIFVIRRKKSVLSEKYSFEQYNTGIKDLLYGDGELSDRYQTFIDTFREVDPVLTFEMASEILHYTRPDQHWLWSRWLWDHKNNTGAIPLVTNEEFKLEGSTYGERYMSVGKAIAFIHSMAESAEFQFINRTLFGTDVFLSCVYVIYAYTVLKIKMTDEFNKVMPGLSEFSRRILGIYKSKELTVA